jgi:hypothetical protein
MLRFVPALMVYAAIVGHSRRLLGRIAARAGDWEDGEERVKS